MSCQAVSGFEARGREVAHREVPQRLGGDVRLAVLLAPAGAVAAAAVALDEPRRGRRRVGGVHVPVLVADARAVEAGVPVPAAVPRLVEAAAHARDVGRHQRGDIGVGLRRVVIAAAVVVVEAVPPLVEEDAGDLAGVVAAAARLEEVDRRPVPVGVAGLVEVDVVRQLRLEPGVRRQPRAPLLGDAIEVVEAGPRRVRVAGARSRRDDAVGPGPLLEVEVGVAGHALVDRAAGVVDRDVGAGQAGDGRAACGAAGEDPHVSGRRRAAVDRHVRVRHRPGGLLAAVGADLVVRDRIDASLDLGVLGVVEERDDFLARRVDAPRPGARLAGDPDDEAPDELVGDACSGGSGERSLVAPVCGRRKEDLLGDREVCDGVGAEDSHVTVQDLPRRRLVDRRLGGVLERAPTVSTEGGKAAARDEQQELLPVDLDAVDGALEEEDRVVLVHRPRAGHGEDELRVPDLEERLIRADEGVGLPDDVLQDWLGVEGEPADPRPLHEQRRPRAAIDEHVPAAPVLRLERRPSCAFLVEPGNGVGGLRDDADRPRRIGDHDPVEPGRTAVDDSGARDRTGGRESEHADGEADRSSTAHVNPPPRGRTA